MAEPARKQDADINPEIRPRLTSIPGGGERTPERGNLELVKKLDENPEAPADQSVPDAESAPKSNVIRGPWANNVSESGPQSVKQKLTVKSFLRKQGPLGIIVSVLLGGGILAGLSVPSLLLMHIQDALMERFDVQNTSMSVRANRLLANKINRDATSGSCNVVKIACRFARPSNAFLDNAERNGIRALDANGDVVKRTSGLFPNGRPETYELTRKDGTIKTYTAPEFAAAINSGTDLELRNATYKSFYPRRAGLTDSVFRSIEKKFGFSTNNTLANAEDSDTVRERLNGASEGENTGARAASEAGEEAAESLLGKLIRQYGQKILSALARAGKGGAFGVVAGGACLVTNVPGLLIGVSRAYDMSMLVPYAAVPLTTAGAMKAGAPDLTTAATSTVASQFTDTVGGKSGMDSYGMNYALFGDTAPKDDSYKKYAPGASVISSLGGVNQFTSSKGVSDVCKAALNPVTGAAVNAALVAAGGATFGATAAAAAINLIAGLAISEVLNAAMPLVLDGAVALLSPYMGDIMGFFLGDLTANLAGPAHGDAFASGASHMFGQTANAGGNMPLSVEDAVAYNSLTKEVNLAQAEIDRSTRSPFDATSKNTFLGSIVNNFLPYFTQLNSFSGAIKTVASLPLTSVASLFKPSIAAADDPAAIYELCDDPAIKDPGIAAGPFCNVEYGIPVEYLNKDPQEVVNYLVGSGDINPNTGNPVEREVGEEDHASLYSWMQLCTDGSTDQVAHCQIEDETTAMYAVYTIDHRIQRVMDGMDDTDSATGPEGLVLPVGEGYRITSGWGPRSCEGCSSWHKAIDFIGGGGVVKAVLDGTVINIGDPFGNNTVSIQHADGLISQYLHMYPGDIAVSVGDTVTAGQQIGVMGSAGQSNGTHLHFELKVSEVTDMTPYEGISSNPRIGGIPAGTYINPIEYYSRYGIEINQ